MFVLSFPADSNDRTDARVRSELVSRGTRRVSPGTEKRKIEEAKEKRDTEESFFYSTARRRRRRGRTRA